MNLGRKGLHDGKVMTGVPIEDRDIGYVYRS
jgi:hypothetical protein